MEFHFERSGNTVSVGVRHSPDMDVSGFYVNLNYTAATTNTTTTTYNNVYIALHIHLNNWQNSLQKSNKLL